MLFIAVDGFGQAQNFSWVRQTRGNGAYGFESVRQVALDQAGNCYVAGRFNSTALTFTDSSVTNVFGVGAFIAKYDRAGNLLWARQPLGANSVIAGAAADAVGNCYVTGHFGNYTNTFAGNTLTNASGNTVFFAIKYDANGNALWAAQATPGAATGGAFGAGTDANGNLYAMGFFMAPTMQLGSFVLTNSSTGSGAFDFFLAKFDTSGNVVWAQRGGPVTFGPQVCMSTDASGNTSIALEFSGVGTFGGITLQNTNQPVCLVKYDRDGNALWAQPFTGVAPVAIRPDAVGNDYLTGVMDSTSAQFGSVTLSNTGTAGGPFIVKYDTDGTALWAVNAQGQNSNQNFTVGEAIAVDGAGNSYISGDFRTATLTFDAATTLTNDYGSSSIPGYVAKYDTAGHFLWAKKFGGENDDNTYAMASDKWGALYLAGVRTSTNATFDDLILTNTPDVLGIFVARIEPPQLSIQPLGGGVTLAWPTNAVGLGLESAADLNGGGWTPVANAPSVVGNQNVVSNAVSSGSAFYRLNIQ